MVEHILELDVTKVSGKNQIGINDKNPSLVIFLRGWAIWAVNFRGRLCLIYVPQGFDGNYAFVLHI